MKYLESPENLERTLGYKSIFLAGGITGCPDWQQEMRQLLSNTDLIVLNPRRANFSIDDPDVALEQITWEYKHLKITDQILFWFPKETLQPIVLFELGTQMNKKIRLSIGIHPKYTRRQDVEIQTEIARPDIKIVYSLEALAQQVIETL